MSVGDVIVKIEKQCPLNDVLVTFPVRYSSLIQQTVYSSLLMAQRQSCIPIHEVLPALCCHPFDVVDSWRDKPKQLIKISMWSLHIKLQMAQWQ